MNWPAVAITSYLLLGADLGLREGLRLSPTHIAPSLIIPFIVFVALFAPATAALWTAVLIGLVVDLSTQRGDNLAVIAGPHALGYFVAAHFILWARTVVIRRNALTLSVLSIIAAGVASVVAVALLTMRRMYGDPVGFVPADEFVHRLMSSLLTGGTGLVLAFVLFPLLPVFGFQDSVLRRFARRD